MTDQTFDGKEEMLFVVGDICITQDARMTFYRRMWLGGFRSITSLNGGTVFAHIFYPVY